ncbi:MAG TPA: hypothetical protein VIL37_13390 [Natronosporangium sp.]
MPRIGITGHTRLSREAATFTLETLTAVLRERADPDLHGVTCLARGADQLFARAVLAARGTYEVVLPAEDYQERIVDRADRRTFDELLGKATAVRTMPFRRSSRTAYLAASTDMLDRCEVLFAVWDGGPSLGVGDTAHVVSMARARRIPVEVFWPG